VRVNGPQPPAVVVGDGEHGGGRPGRGDQLGDGGLGDLALVEAGGQRGGDALQALVALAGGALAVAGGQQLALVALAIGCVERGRAHEQRGAAGIAAQHRVDEHRQPPAVGADDVDGDLAHRALHLQQRCVVRLVVDPPAGREQVLEPPAADQVLAPVAGPGQERLVDLDDQPARQRRQVAARRVLVQILGALLEQRLVDRVARLVDAGHGG
jgi:hypothetical protein